MDLNTRKNKNAKNTICKDSQCRKREGLKAGTDFEGLHQISASFQTNLNTPSS